MVAIIFQFIIFLTALMSLFGCAGISANAGPYPEISFQHRVQEKFNFNIRSETVRKELKMIRTKNLTPGNALEIKILQKIALVSKKEDLRTVFDTLWENEKNFQSILSHPNKTDKFIPSLALIYYLLSSSTGISWQEETSEKLYHDVFEKLESHKLSGYALHFYTLALLNNGKYKAALPWLERLKKNTSIQIFIEDLQKAFIMSENGRDFETAVQLLSMICTSKTQNDIKIDESRIDFAVISMIKKGYISTLKNKLAPILNEFPELKKLSFAKRITEYTMIQNSSKRSSGPIVWVKVQVIKADNKTNYIDPELAIAYSELQKTLNYSSFKLLDSKVFRLTAGDEAKLNISSKINAELIALKVNDTISRLKIIISQKRKEIFNTIIESIDGGVTTIGGPQTRQTHILLRVTTYNEYSL
ncbi:MAG: hypothetical protein HOJ48_13590 [Desulfobacula sp.]|jgi:hypothetical protein|uniref:hypothetical protein n=1 Tax=Desulfobacula sp. TaxID=2593537 RepID=UPI001D45B613|nr:hypothetical protein [Deltaproteobacteria bacterium]MBT6340319.1 hypothetical protein [Desulfobacula sp.]MBT7632005.1 hypothetical protein [Desulfobacula sp.]